MYHFVHFYLRTTPFLHNLIAKCSYSRDAKASYFQRHHPSCDNLLHNRQPASSAVILGCLTFTAQHTYSRANQYKFTAPGTCRV